MDDAMKNNRRSFLQSTALGASATLFGVHQISNANPPERPNIILCMADDQGWGDMAYNGHPLLHTPNFDSFAKEGLRFEQFYAAAPVCSPTRGSVMTGRHPNRFGCFSWGNTLRPQEITIAEALKSAGYVTGHFGKWHLGSVQKGSPVNPGASGFDEWLSAPNFYDNDAVMSREGNAIQTKGESSMLIVDAALEFIERHSKNDQPFLAVVWFGSPHLPHEAIERDRELYKDEEESYQHFLGEITGMDRAFGKLRNQIREKNIHQDTLLWYCSDNGGLPKHGSTGGRGHKAQIYEGGLRVPAIVEWPGKIKAPQQTSIPCSTSDIYPTLLDITGVDLPNQPPLDGVSLASLFQGEKFERPPIGFWSYPSKGVRTPSREWMPELLKSQQSGSQISQVSRLRLDAAEIKTQYPDNTFPGHSAWLDWPWKLHRIQNKDSSVKFELYNLHDDPLEAKNVIAQQKERAKPMKTSLEQWMISVVNSMNGKDYSSQS
ncbi:MAG: sulfatase-like hydrolase/transferase [Candidatus Hinthialibacter antarcticus]|nr:sulfatase-like hydrolase/transferase [Candidatus Hinthialibacter antarcticus]